MMRDAEERPAVAQDAARPAAGAFPGLLVLAAALLLPWIYIHGIVSHPLKWEEPRRCLVAMEMIHRGDYVVPRVLGEPYLKKPPLQGWLIVLLAGNDLRRVGALAVRSLSLLALAGTAAVLWRLGTGAGRRARQVAPALVFVTLGTVLQSGRAGEVDSLLCFFVAAAFGLFELGRRRGSPWLQWCAPQPLLAAGVLTKVLAPIFFFPPVLYCAWRHRRDFRLRPAPFLTGLLLLGGLVALWLAPYSWLNPGAGIAGRWATEVAVRTVGKDPGQILVHGLSYPLQLLGWTLPWSIPLLLLALGRRSRLAARRVIAEEPFLALCRAVVVSAAILFLFVPEQKGRYLIPALPAFSVLVAALLERAISTAGDALRRASASRRLGTSPWPWIALAGAWTALVLAAARTQLERPSAGLVPALLGLALLGATAAAARRGGGRRRGATACLVIGLLYGIFYAGILEPRHARRAGGTVVAARELARELTEDRPVVCHQHVDLGFAQALARASGRLPVRRPASPGAAYWIARSGRAAPAQLERVATSGPYTLWRADEPPQAWSLLAEPLYPPPLGDAVRAEREALLERARVRVAEAPGDPDGWIWLGRRTAYLGRFREAVAVYDDALGRFPDEPHLLRHRGHRMLTLRRLPDALRDLERAAGLVAGRPDEVEPDGLPNPQGIPTSTLQGNIWYHLGLARYVLADAQGAARAFGEARELATNPDSLCAATSWLYAALRRAGRDAEARRALEAIAPDLEILENHAYHRLLLFYRDELGEQELIEWAERSTLDFATVAYGVANRHLVEGRREQATRLLDRVIAGDQWPAFGHLAAEADLARILDRAL